MSIFRDLGVQEDKEVSPNCKSMAHGYHSNIAGARLPEIPVVNNIPRTFASNMRVVPDDSAGVRQVS